MVPFCQWCVITQKKMLLAKSWGGCGPPRNYPPALEMVWEQSRILAFRERKLNPLLQHPLKNVTLNSHLKKNFYAYSPHLPCFVACPIVSLTFSYS